MVIRSLILALVWYLAIGMLLPLAQQATYAAYLVSLPAPTRLDVPVQGVRATALRDSWHAGRQGGRKHEGVDIFSPRGTPVRAATEGIISRVGSNKLGGKVVWVLGPAGQRHYYAHLDGYAHIRSGQRIEAGTLLGFVGNTGNARTTPPHLHYGVYGTAGALNPFPLLVRNASR